MIAYLWNLIVGQFCNHKWEDKDRVAVWGTRKDVPNYYEQNLRCTKCGIWKSVRL